MEKALTMADFVSVSYCNNFSAIVPWTCIRCQLLPGFLLTSLIDDTDWDVTGYVGYYPEMKAKLVIFRGTRGKDMTNWIENLRFRQHSVRLNISFPGSDEIRVHNGFSRIWSIPFKDRVVAAVKNLTKIYGDGPLYIGGHSSGGATAQLAAFHLRMAEGYEDVHVYTFGSPRVGNWAFAAKLTEIVKESWRFTHNRDIVPTVPWMNMGFWHAAREVYQQEKMIPPSSVITTYKICDATGEDPLGRDSKCWGIRCRSLKDHYIYLNRIMEDDTTC